LGEGGAQGGPLAGEEGVRAREGLLLGQAVLVDEGRLAGGDAGARLQVAGQVALQGGLLVKRVYEAFASNSGPFGEPALYAVYLRFRSAFWSLPALAAFAPALLEVSHLEILARAFLQFSLPILVIGEAPPVQLIYGLA